jgi:hypothetical protein
MKRSLSVLSIAVTSMLALTGCPGGGGSGNNNNTAIGVGNGQISSVPNESCNVQPNYYTCTQTLNGLVMNTAAISFTTQQDFCSKINDNFTTTNKDPLRGQVIAMQTRQQLSMQRCQNIGGVPGAPTQPVNGMKTLTCQLSVKKGHMIYEGQPQQIMLSPYLRRQTIPAMAIRTSGNGFFRVSRWVSIARLNIEYSPSLAGTATADQIKMSVAGIDGDIAASVVGSVNAETRIEIQPKDSEDGQTTLIASCVAADATQAVLVPATGAMSYQCIGTETADGRTTKINYVNQISDVVTSGISITNAVFVQGDQASGVTFAQELPRQDDSVISLKSKLTAATSVSIEKLGYSLKVKCQPK